MLTFFVKSVERPMFQCYTIFMSIKSAAYFFSAYRKLLRSYTDFQLNALEGYDLSPNEIVVLSSIETMPTASEIAYASDVSKALVSRSVKLLKDKNYITATVSQSDKREQDLALTEEGKHVAELIDEANRRFFATAFANFEDNEKEALRMLLGMMMRNLNIDR